MPLPASGRPRWSLPRGSPASCSAAALSPCPSLPCGRPGTQVRGVCVVCVVCVCVRNLPATSAAGTFDGAPGKKRGRERGRGGRAAGGEGTGSTAAVPLPLTQTGTCPGGMRHPAARPPHPPHPHPPAPSQSPGAATAACRPSPSPARGSRCPPGPPERLRALPSALPARGAPRGHRGGTRGDRDPAAWSALRVPEG